jgi:hypothetical protein
MSQLAGIPVTGQDLYQESLQPLHKLGTLGFNAYGDKFRYVKNGAAALVTGNLLQEPAEDTNFRSMVAAAGSAIGANTISVTLGGTAVTAGMFDDGLLVVESATGIGQTFRILSHTVQTSTTGTCVFTLDRPVKIAVVVTTSQISVHKNPFNGVIQYPVTTQTGGAVGIALYAMTASTAAAPVYGWIQSGGDTAALYDTGTNTSNGISGIGPSAAVAGSVKPASGAEGEIIIGFAREVVSVDSTMGFVHLTID